MKSSQDKYMIAIMWCNANSRVTWLVSELQRSLIGLGQMTGNGVREDRAEEGRMLGEEKAITKDEGYNVE